MNKPPGHPSSFFTNTAGALRKSVLIFGAGKSATSLIDYMIDEAEKGAWNVVVADADLLLAASKVKDRLHAQAIAVNVEDAGERDPLVESADIVLSLLPPRLHFLVAQACVSFGKNLLTASYTDDNMRSLQAAIENKKLLFLCEMGLDPGIDHMSAMQLIHRIQHQGGAITSFYSHCGGLVAPESDNNPWHYKISWNTRNIITAGQAGAIFRQEGRKVVLPYNQLFDEHRVTTVPGIGPLAWYPNRDSLEYIRLYQLDGAATFVRTTLRYPAFCYGWKKIIDSGLLAEKQIYETDGMTLQFFFSQHFDAPEFKAGHAAVLKTTDLFTKQLEHLGLHDDATTINKGRCSAMDVLEFALETKLALAPQDKDMIVMLHEIDYLQNGKNWKLKSHLIVKGSSNLQTAMAKTVGLPLGIAAKLILQGTIQTTGLRVPIIPEIYVPVLKELENHGICFSEELLTD